MKLTLPIFIGTLALAAIAHADIDTVLPNGNNGLQKSDYAACQQALEPCQTKRDAIMANIACSQRVYASQVVCAQTQAIEAQTGVLPELKAIHAQNRVAWFSVHHSADGIDNYYMLDSSGRLLGLATSQNPLIANNPMYKTFMKAYPNGALQSMVTTKPNKTPQVRQQADGSVQLIFHQSVKAQDCVACQPVGVAQLMYYFDHQGRYQAVQIASITPVTI